MGRNQRVIEEKPGQGMSFNLSQDKRKTMVLIDNELYDLIPSGISLKDILKETDFNKVPHVRHLNPIPKRTETEQVLHNQEVKMFHDLSLETPRKNDKVTSIKKAQILGANIPKEVERLLKEKKQALKDGNTDLAKSIRKQLRALDYKRYINKED